MAEVVSKPKDKSPVPSKKEAKADPYILREGTATPYVAFFGEDGSPLINPDTNIYLGAYVSKFDLNLGDETEDSTKIILNSGNPTISDIPEIQTGKMIYIQYGYIYPDGSFRCSNAVILKVLQLEAVFNDQGTEVTLSCKDSLCSQRKNPPFTPKTENETLTDYLNTGLGQGVGILIEMFKPYTEEETKNVEESNREVRADSHDIK